MPGYAGASAACASVIMDTTDNFSYLLPFIFFVFGCLSLAAGRWGGGAFARFWGLGFCASAAGFTVPILGRSLPPMWQALCADALFYVAFYAYGQALLTRFRLRAWRRPLAAFGVLAYAVLCYFVVIKGNLRGELATSDIGCAILLGIPLLMVARHVRRPIDKLLLLIVLAVVIETITRVAALLILTNGADYASLDAFFTSDYAFYTQVTASILGFLLALAVLASVAADVIEGHRHAAEHDPLTDLLNRRGFERALPLPDKAGFAAGTVIVCDIDHFKLVNDRFGHAAGDMVIARLAAVLVEAYPAGALVTRLGGEEFAAFLPHAKPADATQFAEMARLAFEATDWRANHSIDQAITASFGVSATARSDHSVHDAVARADSCLYAAKSAGRNRVAVEGNLPTPFSGSPRIIISSSG